MPVTSQVLMNVTRQVAASLSVVGMTKFLGSNSVH
jgi:hypothetical protein